MPMPEPAAAPLGTSFFPLSLLETTGLIAAPAVAAATTATPTASTTNSCNLRMDPSPAFLDRTGGFDPTACYAFLKPPESGGAQAAPLHNVRMATILVVDDEPTIREVVVRYLKREGYDTLEAADRLRAKELLVSASPCLVVLDVMLPGIDGLQLCRWIRANSSVPVIMLTARGAETDRIVGLELGADDYVAKPFSPRELVARVRYVLRRAAPPTGSKGRIELGPIALDAGTRVVTKDGERLKLTAREFELLWFLASHPGKVFSRDQLMSRVWGYAPAFETGTVTVHVRRLREKIEAEPSRPRHLETVWGVGYRLVA